MSKQLLMVRTGAPPTLTIPEGFVLRWGEAGDELTWCRICMGMFGVQRVEQQTWQEKMGDNPRVHLENVAFLLTTDGRPAGTATAKLDEDSGIGVLHMVAVREEFRGKGLSEPLCAAVVHRLHEQKRPLCKLTTDDFRIPAIKTYLKLGWLPVIEEPEQRARWEKILYQLGKTHLPCLDENFRPAAELRAEL